MKSWIIVVSCRTWHARVHIEFRFEVSLLIIRYGILVSTTEQGKRESWCIARSLRSRIVCRADSVSIIAVVPNSKFNYWCFTKKTWILTIDKTVSHVSVANVQCVCPTTIIDKTLLLEKLKRRRKAKKRLRYDPTALIGESSRPCPQRTFTSRRNFLSETKNMFNHCAIRQDPTESHQIIWQLPHNQVKLFTQSPPIIVRFRATYSPSFLFLIFVETLIILLI